MVLKRPFIIHKFWETPSVKKYLHIHSFFLISRKSFDDYPKQENFFHIPNEACGQKVLELPDYICFYCNSSGFDVSKKKKELLKG